MALPPPAAVVEYSDASDQHWMAKALRIAARAAVRDDEVPVGCVIVHGDRLIAAGANRNISAKDPTAHAEVVALRRAGHKLDNHRLIGTTLYVTLEPCAMCAMAMIHARVGRVVYGAHDPKTGADGSVFDLLQSPRHNHRLAVRAGVGADQAAALLRQYFGAKRAAARAR